MDVSDLGSIERQVKRVFGVARAGGNVGTGERVASMLLGGGLLLYGARRRGLLPALLGGAFLYRGVSGQCALYRATGISSASGAGGERARQTRTSVEHGQGVKVASAVIIERPAEELYRFWRELSNLPKFMTQLEKVEGDGNGRSHWIFKGIGGKKLSWDAEIINDLPGELLAWRSLPGASLDHAGSVRFETIPGGRGTKVKVTMEYRPPAGKLGVVTAKVFGIAPEQVIKADLHRFKQLLETGEIPSVAGQPQAG